MELLIAFIVFAAFPVAILIIAYWWGEPE